MICVILLIYKDVSPTVGSNVNQIWMTPTKCRPNMDDPKKLMVTENLT